MKTLISIFLSVFLFCASALLVQSQIDTTDSLALVAFYNSTDGPNWKTNTNWLQPGQPVNTWFGIIISGNRVTQISLSNNNLSGNIPPEIGDLSSLEYLYLNTNNLSGSIPPEIGNLTNLKELYLRQNNLSGAIPPEIGNLTNLITLVFFKNSLSDSIPPEIGNLTNLTLLNFHLNNLSGSIPPEIGNLTNLTTLFLNTNSLSDSIPSEIGNLTNLRNLALNGNLLNGSIPPEIGNLINLEELTLDGNSLTGTIPAEIENLVNVSELDLSENNLSGSIPSEISNLTELSQLKLNDNSLNGNIPAVINNLTNLTTLKIEDNYFTFANLDSISGLSINEFTYAPQKQIELNTSQVTKNLGGELHLNIFDITVPDIISANNQYKWWKDGDSITSYSSFSELNITNLDTLDEGDYYYSIINPDLPELTLFSDLLLVEIIDFYFTLTPDSIDENVPSGSLVGIIDVNLPEYSLTLITGDGTNDADNANFTIINDSLLINISPDYEVQQEYYIYVQAEDIYANTFRNALVISVNNLNDNSPIIQNQTFSINENSSNGTLIHIIEATDADGNLNPLFFSLMSGNTNNAFALTASGDITVNNAAELDFETEQQYILTVEVSDGTFTDNATMTINVNNVNDNAPIVENQTFSIDENSASSTPIETIIASDADGNLNTFIYGIISGNTGNAFSIDTNTGIITINNSSELDYETIQQFVLIVEVSDGTFTDDATMTININNINDNAPIIENQTFSIDENSSKGTVVNTISASDADGGLSTLLYTIISGNTNNAFALSANGDITVNNTTELDYETVQQYILTVEVSDGIFSDDAIITIDINDIIETGIKEISKSLWNTQPNPSTGEFSITFDESIDYSNITLEVINANGMVVHKIFLDSTEQLINISYYPKGIYTIRILGEDIYGTRKIILQ